MQEAAPQGAASGFVWRSSAQNAEAAVATMGKVSESTPMPKTAQCAPFTSFSSIANRVTAFAMSVLPTTPDHMRRPSWPIAAGLGRGGDGSAAICRSFRAEAVLAGAPRAPMIAGASGPGRRDMSGDGDADARLGARVEDWVPPPRPDWERMEGRYVVLERLD